MARQLTLVSILFCAIFFISVCSAETFFCPNTSQYVATGDSESAVLEKCGKPTEKEKKEENEKVSFPSQVWFYEASRPPIYQPEGNPYFMPMTVTFVKGRVTQIELSDKYVESASVCIDGGSIKLGDDTGTVNANCGDPDVINETTQTEVVGTDKVENWVYDFGNYQDSVRFKFVDGILKEIYQ